MTKEIYKHKIMQGNIHFSCLWWFDAVGRTSDPHKILCHLCQTFFYV